jgi:hypothetical protein
LAGLIAFCIVTLLVPDKAEATGIGTIYENMFLDEIPYKHSPDMYKACENGVVSCNVSEQTFCD